MNNSTSFGLKSIQMGPVDLTGAMGTALTTIQATALDTCSFEGTPPSVADIMIEESDFPLDSLVTKASQFSVKFTSYDVDPVQLQSVLGGVYTAKTGQTLGKLTAATVFPVIEMSVILTSLSGHGIRVVRARVLPTLKWNFAKSKLASVDYLMTILLPTDGVSTPYEIRFPN